MFQAQSQNQYIPSKSVAIKPEVTSAVGPSEEIRIHVPSFIGFLDPNKTYLKATIQFKNARGQLVPDPVGGVHSLFRQVLYRDGANSTTLELNEDYGCWKSALSQFTRSPSVLSKEELFAGVQDVVGNLQGDKTLYYDEQLVDPAATDTAPDTEQRSAHKVMVQTQLHSGIWSQGNIIPVSAMQGMRIQLQTDDILRSCLYPSLKGEKSLSRVTGSNVTLTTYAKVATEELRTQGSTSANNGAADTGYIALTSVDWQDNPFAVNDVLYISDDDAPHTNEEALGTVIGFYRSVNKLGIVYNPLRDHTDGLNNDHAVDSLIYYKVEDREQALDFYTLADNLANLNTKSGTQVAGSYELSDIELICQSVQPPPDYVERMLRAAASSTGISFDFMAYELHRHNQSNTSGLVQAQIPTTVRRAKALFCQPLATASADARSWASRSLSGIVDNAQSYEYIHGTAHYPSRLAPLKRYNTQVGTDTGLHRVEALHMSELQKAIVNVGERVLNLQKIEQNFVISRSLTKYGQVMDLSPETLSVRIDYLNGTKQKILNNYVVGVRRVTISGSGVEASF